MSAIVWTILALASMALLLWGGVRFVLWLDRAGEASLRRIVEGTLSQAASDASPPVNLSFCAYRSCLAYWVQSHYRMRIPYDTAVVVLRRLHHYTLRWGWPGPAAIIIPWSFLTYGIERWRLRRQLSAGIATGGPVMVENQEKTVFSLSPFLSASEDNPCAEPDDSIAASRGSRSPFRVFIGCICLVLSVPFAVLAIVCAVKKEFDVALGGAIVTAALAWTAYHWIQKRR